MPFRDDSHVVPHTLAKSGHRVALVIGNGRYAQAAALANPANDAKAVATVLSRMGFDVVSGFDLDLHAMGDVQAEFEGKLRAKPDVALLFYAGHGLQVRGKNYLVPIDAAITEMAHLASRALLFNDVLEPMAESAGASLIFLDACRDNPFTRSLARTLGETTTRSNAVRGGLAKIDKVAGTFIAYATAPDTVAYDGKGLNSPFTGALLKHVETPGLSVADMMIDVRNAVLAETGGRQEPWDQSSLRARFYFVPKAEEPVATPAISAAADEWAAVQHTTSLAVLASFRERYPGPPWSTYADIRIAELREADAARRQEIEAKRGKSAAASAPATAQRNSVSTAPPKPWPARIIGIVLVGLVLAAFGGVWWWSMPQPSPQEKAAMIWVDLKKSEDEAAIEKFIAAHPTTPAADEAKTRLADIKRQKEIRGEAGRIQKARTAAAATEWKRVQETADEALIEQFIAAHPNTPAAEEANTRLAEIGRQKELRAADEAKTRLAKLKSQREELDRMARSAAAAREWNRGHSTADEKWLEEFISKYPDTAVAIAASIRLADLRRLKSPHVLSSAEERALKPKDEFQECDVCPRMVVVPAGKFLMGSPPDEKERDTDEGPVHEVAFPRAFAVAKFEATFAEWDACAADGGCTSNRRPSDQSWGRDRRPVINVSWNDAQEYVAWLKRKTGKGYRLLSEAEWEYATRAETRTRYSFGDEFSNAQANNDKRGTVPVAQYPPNAFGLHDMHGNVWEWVEDCWIDNYNGAPSDGSARTTGDCSRRVLRGGSWGPDPRNLRSANRGRSSLSGLRLSDFGFRLGRTLDR